MKRTIITLILLTFSFIGFSQEIDVKPKKGQTDASQHMNKESAKSYFKRTFRYKNSNDKEPLYVLDGKAISYDKLSKVKPEFIEQIFVLKNKKATDKYGIKGKNGVVEIITKK